MTIQSELPVLEIIDHFNSSNTKEARFDKEITLSVAVRDAIIISGKKGVNEYRP